MEAHRSVHLAHGEEEERHEGGYDDEESDDRLDAHPLAGAQMIHTVVPIILAHTGSVT